MMKIDFCAGKPKCLMTRFLGKEKERKVQYQWYHSFRSYLVEVTGLEPAASCSQMVKNTRFIDVSGYS